MRFRDELRRHRCQCSHWMREHYPNKQGEWGDCRCCFDGQFRESESLVSPRGGLIIIDEISEMTQEQWDAIEGTLGKARPPYQYGVDKRADARREAKYFATFEGATPVDDDD